MGALFRVPIVAFDEAVGRRIALVPHDGTPLAERRARRRRRLRPRRRARRAAGGSARALRRARLDPARSGGVAQRRNGRHGRAVRAEPTAQGQTRSSGGRSERRDASLSARGAADRRRGAREQQSGATQACKNKQGPLAGPFVSASRLHFRPPRPTGLPLQGCPFFVEPLGRGFDLVALRARCKREATGYAGTGVKGDRVAKIRAICGACGDPHGVLAAGVRPTVEPAVARVDRRSPLRRAASATARARATTSTIVDAPPGPRTESVSVCASRSQSARSSIPGSRSIQSPCVSSMSSRDGANTSKTSRPPGASSARAASERLEPLLVARAGADTPGTDTSRARTRSSTGGRRRSPSRRSSRSAMPASRARSPQTASIPADESTPITSTPAIAVGIAIRPVPTPSSTTGPPPAASASST